MTVDHFCLNDMLNKSVNNDNKTMLDKTQETLTSPQILSLKLKKDFF